METKEVIMITDGDKTARKAVEEASKNLGLEVIAKSAGNPTPCSGAELVEEINNCSGELAVVMFDDQGDLNCGQGETAMKVVAGSDNIDVLGVIAVASNAKEVEGVQPTCSITKEGELVKLPVDKSGKEEKVEHTILEGDTVDVINEFEDMLVVGIGDLGKMEGKDDYHLGAPITTKAIKEILKRSGREDGLK
ncbi:stage V sporulation protein AE [Natroniella sp. ANB-PHB2]|uniref:stage V sporulation protein AE n=1 Tax=Natroniella sp. ANB-PHB2 TaxID=3384444 RepID=UPI0038D4BE44